MDPPPGASGTDFEAFHGPAQFQVRTPERFCILRMADWGLSRIAALAGLGQIADCTLGALRCKDARDPIGPGGCRPAENLLEPA
eukprot:11757299-Alexandrium_andersonii.AAC.1